MEKVNLENITVEEIKLMFSDPNKRVYDLTKNDEWEAFRKDNVNPHRPKKTT